MPDFHANGSRLLSRGWLLADPEAEGEEVTLPKVTKGDVLTLQSLDAEERQTEPPSRYTEAGLVKELEKRDIGRPSTYASIIKTIVDRGYVLKEGKTLKPTDTGDIVSSFLEAHFPTYIGDTFTAEMEQKLDDIAIGKAKYEKTLKDFYGPFLKEVKAKEKIDKITPLIPPIPMPAPVFVALYGGIELTLGVTGSASGVAHFAHLGGLLGGWLMTGRPCWRRSRMNPIKVMSVPTKDSTATIGAISSRGCSTSPMKPKTVPTMDTGAAARAMALRRLSMSNPSVK